MPYSTIPGPGMAPASPEMQQKMGPFAGLVRDRSERGMGATQRIRLHQMQRKMAAGGLGGFGGGTIVSSGPMNGVIYR